MTIDVLFLAKNRLEFTRQSIAALLANTNWDLVRRLLIWDDDCADGTGRYLAVDAAPQIRAIGIKGGIHNGVPLGAPAAIMNAVFRERDAADMICKLDNDVIVPPAWLDQCAAVMEAHPELDLLGIEPPASRVPSREGMPQKPVPELETEQKYRMGLSPTEALRHEWRGYAPCDSIGGIGLMRTTAFLRHEPIRPHSTYGGFTEWQLAHGDIVKGWVCPPLKCFLLDRLPEPKWAMLSREYEAKGWQRPWGRYPMSAKDQLWNWWVPVEQEANASR